MNTISNERVEFYATTKPPFGYTGSDINKMARELLALRKERERASPVAWHVYQWRESPGGWDWYLVRSFSPAPNNSPGFKNVPLYTAPPAPVVPDCLQRLLKHAEGLTFGSDWNNGTAAKYHRDALIQAVKDCRAAMLKEADDAAS